MGAFINFCDSFIPEPNSGCWLWTRAVDGFGYAIRHVWGDRQRLGHRWSWEVHFGPIPAGLCVCHKCDVRSCVNPNHLFLGTSADNTADMDRKGRRRNSPRPGELHHSAKLTTAAVLKIREASGTLDVIARDFGVSRSTAWDIRSGATWRHLKEEVR